MKVKRIKLSLGVTISLGDYQSFRADVGAEADDTGGGFDQLRVLLTQRMVDTVESFGLRCPVEVEEEDEKEA